MAEIILTQVEADILITMQKIRINNDTWNYPTLGGSIAIPLLSINRRENFLLDIWRGRVDLLKGNYQNRARQVVILVRLDFGGSPHRNPDGEEIPSPHLHLYREGFGDKWAMPVPCELFPHINDLWKMLEDFMRYCNIIQPPIIQRGLFT
ncbi:MAG: hypothetical protein QMD03_06970 [Syntrophales bacterium]|nr:hypothetical protein [Syntrophales bacterium]